MTRTLLTGTLGRLLLTALTIALLALVTRGLRVSIEAEALSAIEETHAGPSRARLVLEVADRPVVGTVLAPVKRERPPAILSGTARPWLCAPATIKPVGEPPLSI